MINTILGVFDDAAAARRAMDELRASSLEFRDFSVIARSGEGAADHDHLSAGEGAAVGAVWGGLVGLAALLIPGVGPFVAGGALFAALTGAATGAVVGGVAGALIDNAGLSEEEARGYEALVHGGKTLVAVKADDANQEEVRRILAGAGAVSLRDNQTDIAGTNAPVHIAAEGAAAREIEAGLTGSATVVGTPPTVSPPVPNSTMAGPAGLYEAPATRVGRGARGIYDMPTLTEDTDTTAAARSEAKNMAAGSEDLPEPDQDSPGEAGRAVVTEGWKRVGYAGDRQGEQRTAETDEANAEYAVRRSKEAHPADK
jgi:uncharacterized membrane protein